MMDYQLEEINISGIFEKLAIKHPEEIAIVPENLTEVERVEQFVFPEMAGQINKIMKNNQLSVAILGGQLGALRSRKNADIFLPAIYFGASLLSENPTVVNVALNVISNYVTDFLKGTFGQSKVAFEIYIETKGSKKVQRINYKGSATGIKDLGDVIKKINK